MSMLQEGGFSPLDARWRLPAPQLDYSALLPVDLVARRSAQLADLLRDFERALQAQRALRAQALSSTWRTSHFSGGYAQVSRNVLVEEFDLSRVLLDAIVLL